MVARKYHDFDAVENIIILDTPTEQVPYLSAIVERSLLEHITSTPNDEVEWETSIVVVLYRMQYIPGLE